MTKQILLLLALLLVVIGCANATTETPDAAPLTGQNDPEPTAMPSPTAPPEPTATVAPTVAVADDRDAIFALADGWTEVTPGGDARCAHDTEFSFWAKPGTSNKLLVYFQGGGGCWDAASCARGSRLYDASVDQSDHPRGEYGILDFTNPDNPFADHHAIFVPSCTGDTFMGDKVNSYPTDDGETVDIHHRGYANLDAALSWAYANVTAPDSVFVTGCSAGSVGSIRAAPHLINHYADANVVQLGDSLGFAYADPVPMDVNYGSHAAFPDWIPAFDSFDPQAFTMAEFYNAVANFYPDSQFAQFNTNRDSVQLRYHTVTGSSAETFPATLASAIGAIHAESPNFNSYTADGTQHCILRSFEFYMMDVAGVPIRDWVADLAAGRNVDDVRCDACPDVNEEAAIEPPACTEIGQAWVSPIDGVEMVCVPAGEFVMGSAETDRGADDDEFPQHAVTLDAYWIDRTEVSNASFADCVAAGGCHERTPPYHAGVSSANRPDYYGFPEFDPYPVLIYDSAEAAAYCEWAGKQLPTEAQWEKAASGTNDNRIYPWGDEIDCERAAYNLSCDTFDTVPVDANPSGASVYGALNMGGNVWEWVGDLYSAEYYAVSPTDNPTGPAEGRYRTRRGGGWHSRGRDSRVANRADGKPLHYFDGQMGLRCAVSASNP